LSSELNTVQKLELFPSFTDGLRGTTKYLLTDRPNLNWWTKITFWRYV